MSAPDLAVVRSALRRLLPEVTQLSPDLRCERLTGGVEQRSFLVTVAARQYVLRLRADAIVALLDIETEAKVTSAVAAAGLAPRVIAADRESGALLTEYRPGATPWTPATARAAVNIGRAADLLRALHCVRAPLPRFAATDIAERYVADLAAAGRRDVTLSEELARLARAYDGRYGADSLCHNDLVAANVLDGGGLVLVDFEYAVCGAPILDLASLAGMNDYTELQRRELLRAYYGEPVPVASAEFTDVVRMVRLLAMFWALLAAGRSREASGYLQLAEHLRQPLDLEKL